MNQCKECGAILPDNARFCMQCGAAIIHSTEPSGAAKPPKELDFLWPCLAAGAGLGFASAILLALPLGIYLCCLWLVGGGWLAAALLNKQRPGTLTYGDGAFAGVISGMFGAIIYTTLSTLARFAVPPDEETKQKVLASLEKMFEQVPDFPPAAKAFMIQLATGEVTALMVLFIFVTSAITYGLFAMIGGILGAALLQKKKSGK
jgi:hypothetical protein